MYSVIKPRAKHTAAPPLAAAHSEHEGRPRSLSNDEGSRLTSGKRVKGGRGARDHQKRKEFMGAFVLQRQTHRQITNTKFSPAQRQQRATSVRQVTWVSPPVHALS